MEVVSRSTSEAYVVFKLVMKNTQSTSFKDLEEGGHSVEISAA